MVVFIRRLFFPSPPYLLLYIFQSRKFLPSIKFSPSFLYCIFYSEIFSHVYNLFQIFSISFSSLIFFFAYRIISVFFITHFHLRNFFPTIKVLVIAVVFGLIDMTTLELAHHLPAVLRNSAGPI